MTGFIKEDDTDHVLELFYQGKPIEQKLKVVYKKSCCR